MKNDLYKRMVAETASQFMSLSFHWTPNHRSVWTWKSQSVLAVTWKYCRQHPLMKSSIRGHLSLGSIIRFQWNHVSACQLRYLPARSQVLEEDAGPAGSLRWLWWLPLLLLIQRKAWDETLHFNAAWLLCTQRHMAHCCQGQAYTDCYRLLSQHQMPDRQLGSRLWI